MTYLQKSMLRISRVVFNSPYQTVMISYILAFSSSTYKCHLQALSVPGMHNKPE